MVQPTQPRPIRLGGRPVGAGDFPLIITPLVGRTPADIETELQAILPKAPDILEWRIDFFEGIGDVDGVIETARRIRRSAAATPLLLTRRNLSEGGQAIPIDEAAVVRLLARACEAQCVDLIDYELSNPLDHLRHLREVSAAAGVALVLSAHDFATTPDADTLLATFTRAQTLGADVAKVAVMPRDPQDVLTLLGATLQASRTLSVPLISMAMGGLGSTSRIMGWIYGSAASFAVGKSSSAPGQIGIDELRVALAIVRRAVQGG